MGFDNSGQGAHICKNYEMETFIPAVLPIIYAIIGLFPQMPRDERTIADVIEELTKDAFGI